MPFHTFSSVQTILPGLIQTYGLEIKFLEYRLKQDWDRLIGPPLAGHTKPDAIKYRKLFLLAENSVWLQQLVFLKPVLLDKINSFAQGPLISDIILRVGDLSLAASPASKQEDPDLLPVSLTTEGVALSKAWTACLTDPGLRASFARLIARALSNPGIT